MPVWSRIAAGLALAVTLLGFAGFKAYSEKLGPIVQALRHDVFQRRRPADGAGAVQVAKANSERDRPGSRPNYDHFEGTRAASRSSGGRPISKACRRFSVDTLYVITEDDQLRDGKTVLFIGLRSNCVSTVFSFPARLYRELPATPGAA